MSKLNERERFIVRERKLRDQPRTLESLGTELGLSKERVRHSDDLDPPPSRMSENRAKPFATVGERSRVHQAVAKVTTQDRANDLACMMRGESILELVESDEGSLHGT